MRYIIPKQLKEEYKIFDKPKVYLKDVITCGILLGLFYYFNGFVHSWLLIPYWIVATASTYFLIQPARSNPKKRNWEAIILFVERDRTTYFSMNHIQEDENNAK